MKQNFSLGAILSLVTGRMLCNGFGEAKRPTAFLHGDPDGAVYTLTLKDLRPSSAERLIAQYPPLGFVGATQINTENWKEWLALQESIFGEALAIELGEPL